MRRLIALLAAVTAIAVPVVASAAPTCTIEATRAACGNRIIAPPLQSVQFLQYNLEYEDVLTALEGYAPDFIEINTIGEWIGQPDVRSAGDNQIWAMRITDETVPAEGKRQVAISLSVHGNERAGFEGGIRYVEDLLVWAMTDPAHEIYAGDRAFAISDVLAETEIWVANLNVDGWQAGDVTSPGAAYSRTNGNGQDLNRDFPTLGWSSQDQPTEPEAIAWIELVSSMENLTTATDIHGELTSATNSFADMMYPAGQWTPRQQSQELAMAEAMRRTVERKFEEEGVVLQTLFDLLGEEDRPMKPAEYATAYDIVGYDDSGFMGDWYVSQGAIEVDVENFLSHTVPNNVWFPPLAQAHVAAAKGEIEGVIAASMMIHEVQPDLSLGRVAYVFDPERIQRAASDEGAAFDASRMDYFDDLAADAGVPVTRLDAADVATADLSQFDSIVLADLTVPADAQGRAVDNAAYVAALDRFAAGGGQLVLTDRAIQLLPALRPADFTEANVSVSLSDGGHVDFGEFDHPWEADLSGRASQTFYAVPLGYRARGAAPNWGIASAVWDAAGGVTAGSINSGDTVNLGGLAHGQGSIAIFGSVLPTQTTENRIDHGLADYAVTVAGGQVLHTILEYQRS